MFITSLHNIELRRQHLGFWLVLDVHYYKCNTKWTLVANKDAISLAMLPNSPFINQKKININLYWISTSVNNVLYAQSWLHWLLLTRGERTFGVDYRTFPLALRPYMCQKRLRFIQLMKQTKKFLFELSYFVKQRCKANNGEEDILKFGGCKKFGSNHGWSIKKDCFI